MTNLPPDDVLGFLGIKFCEDVSATGISGTVTTTFDGIATLPSCCGGRGRFCWFGTIEIGVSLAKG